ncbi:MAG: tRNA (N(6)-L-threonylcarbamoyladenosine(37)-C(2))-methylthiotransferase [Candidatus Micrarchaeia archaeon]
MEEVFLKTYGCTLNQADSDAIKGLLESAGFSVHVVSSLPDTYDTNSTIIINTCTVKRATRQKILYELQKLNGKANLLVTGCLASADPAAISKYAPNASIVTAPNINKIGEAVNYARKGIKANFDEYKRIDRLSFFSPQSSAIARIPLGDGCLSNCSFCETKKARGPLNSFSPKLVVEAIKLSLAHGAKEIELTSQDTGAYGADIKMDIIKLLEMVDGIEGDFKVRLGMLNPEFMKRYGAKLSEILQREHFYRFIHLPVQSGSDKVLKDMRRPYSSDEAMRAIEMLRDKVEGISIETDIIVGFPTESNDDFIETVEFIKSAKPQITNISKFSPMPHADASKLPQLPYYTINERSATLARLVRSQQLEENKKFIGSDVDILITESNAASYNGRTFSYKEVVLKKGHGMQIDIGSRHTARIIGATANALYGELVS